MKSHWLDVIAFALLVTSATGSTGSEIVIDKYSMDLNYAQVTHVEAVQSSDGSWCIMTTVRHNDEGWDHYADAWQLLDEEGNELGMRILAHPHDDEQPFTRQLCGIKIPEQILKIIVRAKCNMHGYGGQPVLVDLSESDGDKYKVVRNKQ